MLHYMDSFAPTTIFMTKYFNQWELHSENLIAEKSEEYVLLLEASFPQ